MNCLLGEFESHSSGKGTRYKMEPLGTPLPHQCVYVCAFYSQSFTICEQSSAIVYERSPILEWEFRPILLCYRNLQ